LLTARPKESEAVTESWLMIRLRSASYPAGRSVRGRGWLIRVMAVLVVLAGDVGVDGYSAVRLHQEDHASMRDNATAMQATLAGVSRQRQRQ
jgi:hypothetical protein